MRRKLTPSVAAVLLLFLGAQTSLALSWSDIRTGIRRNVRDTASSTSLRRYSDAVLLVYGNEAQRAIVNETWPQSTSLSQSITSGTTYYSFASATDLIRIWRVSVGSINLPEVDLNQLDADNGATSWADDSGSPTAFYYDRTNRTSVGLYPIPSASGTLIIYYYRMVPDLAADADIPFDSDRNLYAYHDLLNYHVSYRILVQENRATEAEAYQTLYDNGLEVMALNVGHKRPRVVAPGKEQKP